MLILFIFAAASAIAEITAKGQSPTIMGPSTGGQVPSEYTAHVFLRPRLAEDEMPKAPFLFESVTKDFSPAKLKEEIANRQWTIGYHCNGLPVTDEYLRKNKFLGHSRAWAHLKFTDTSVVRTQHKKKDDAPVGKTESWSIENTYEIKSEPDGDFRIEFKPGPEAIRITSMKLKPVRVRQTREVLFELSLDLPEKCENGAPLKQVLFHIPSA